MFYLLTCESCPTATPEEISESEFKKYTSARQRSALVRRFREGGVIGVELIFGKREGCPNCKQNSQATQVGVHTESQEVA